MMILSQYRFLAKNPILWRIMYAYGMFYPTKIFSETWSHLACFKRFKQAIAIANPDMVISVHPLCQLMPISIVQQLNKERSSDKLPIAFVTVVTDLGGAHMTWFDKRADFCFVPSEAVRQIACRSGLKSDKIIMHGLPIRPAFWRRQATKSKNVVRGALFLEPDVKTVLLMGGGDGVGGMEKIAIQLAEKLSQSAKRSQIVVICGHNQKTSDNLKARIWPSNVRVVVKGFQKNIDEFMAACDLLVTKAGPGTIAEAMVQGLPMVLSSFLPGQVCVCWMIVMDAIMQQYRRFHCYLYFLLMLYSRKPEMFHTLLMAASVYGQGRILNTLPMKFITYLKMNNV